MKHNSSIRLLMLSGLIAAIYVALTFISNAFGLAYGPVQFRLSEALNVLAVITPAAIPGLTLGCFLSNLASPFPPDVVIGTLATFFSAILMRIFSAKFKNYSTAIAVIIPTLINSIFVGMEITLFTKDFAFLGFLISALPIAIGELAVIILMGIPLKIAIKKYFQ